MPGEDVVQQPTFDATRAVTIQARPEEIWPWLVQMGMTRASKQNETISASVFNAGASAPFFAITGKLWRRSIPHDGPCKEVSLETGNHAINTNCTKTNTTTAFDTIEA
jgi:hypothetical protein